MTLENSPQPNPVVDAARTALIKALLDGDLAPAVEQARYLLDLGVDRSWIVIEGVEKAMGQLDAKCTVAQFNLLEIMLCGRAVTTVMKELFPPGSPPAASKGTVVLATLEGDVHDLGKNISKMVLTASGYRVVDCGKDCPLDRLVETTGQENPLAVGVSGLITPVIPLVRRLRPRLSERGLGEIKVLAGGAALKQASAASLNVDFVAQNAFEGLHYLEQLQGEKHEQPGTH